MPAIDLSIDFSTEPDASPYTHPDLIHLNSDDTAEHGDVASGIYVSSTTGQTSKLAWGDEITDYSRGVISRMVVSGSELANSSAHRGPAILIRSGADIGKGYWLRVTADVSGSRIQLNLVNSRGGYSAASFKPNYTEYTLSEGDTVALELNADNTLTAFYNGEAIPAITQVPLGVYTDDLVPAVCAYRSSVTVTGSVKGFAVGGVKEEAPPATGPYPGSHTVTNLEFVSNALCLYNGQEVPVQQGTLISFQTSTATNDWPVAIDADGFAEITAGLESGEDTFLYAISNDGGENWTDPGTITTTIVEAVE